MKTYPGLSLDSEVYLIRNLQFERVTVKETIPHGSRGDVEVKIQHKGFLQKGEIVKRRDLVSKEDIRDIQASREGSATDQFANQMFDSAVNMTEGAINSAADFAGELRKNFNKFKNEVVTDELLERMRKEAEDTFDPVVAKEKIDTASEVLSGAVKNMHDKMFPNEKKD